VRTPRIVSSTSFLALAAACFGAACAANGNGEGKSGFGEGVGGNDGVGSTSSDAAASPGGDGGGEPSGTSSSGVGGESASSSSGGHSGGSSASSSSSGSSAAASSADAGGNGGVNPTMLPTATVACPDMSNLNGTNVTIDNQAYTVWSGDPTDGPGPLLIYWYATGSNSMEPTWAIQSPQIQRIVAAGGMVAAQVTTTSTGTNTGDGVWYTGDVTIADQVVACAVQKQKIDTRRIWVAGYSAGALQTVYMWYARSGYVSGVISYSGGDITINHVALEDPTHQPCGLASHGAAGQDVIVVDFNQASHTWEMDNPSAFIVDCDDGGNHLSTGPRTAMAPQAIQMLWVHPFGVKPEPYANGLPSDWPSTCVPPPVPANH